MNAVPVPVSSFAATLLVSASLLPELSRMKSVQSAASSEPGAGLSAASASAAGES